VLRGVPVSTQRVCFSPQCYDQLERLSGGATLLNTRTMPPPSKAPNAGIRYEPYIHALSAVVSRTLLPHEQHAATDDDAERRVRVLGHVVQLLLGQTKLESTVQYLGIEVDDALEMAEQTEV
jgi:hypothetical protein